MLQGIKKLVGPKSDDELQIQRYKEILQKRSDPSPELHLKIGRLYEKIGEKANAGIEYRQAAQLYMERNEYVGALVANKLLIRLDREDADANANVAFIELQQGVTLSPQEFNTFLQDVGQPLRIATQQQDSGDTKRPTSRLALSRDRRHQQEDNLAFQADRQQLLDLISGDAEAEERFDASFDAERHSLVKTIEEDLDADTFSQSSSEGDEIDSMPFIDLTKGGEPGERLATSDTVKEDRVSTEPVLDDAQEEQRSAHEFVEETAGPTTRDLLSRLAHCPLFSMLSEAELEELRRYVYLCDIYEGKPVSQSLDEQHSLFVILGGTVELAQKVPDADRKPEPLLLKAGDFWGEHEFLGQSEVEFSAVTKTASTIAEIPKSFLASIAKKYPSLLDLLKKTCKRRCFSPFLRHVALFKELGAEDIQKIAEFLFTKEMKKGSILVREGENDESIFFIESGRVEVYTSFVEREELQVVKMEKERIHLAYLQKGDFFGEDVYFTKEPRSTTIVAQTDGRLLKLPGSHLKKLLHDYPQIESSLKHSHQQRVQATMKTISSELK